MKTELPAMPERTLHTEGNAMQSVRVNELLLRIAAISEAGALEIKDFNGVLEQLVVDTRLEDLLAFNDQQLAEILEKWQAEHSVTDSLPVEGVQLAQAATATVSDAYLELAQASTTAAPAAASSGAGESGQAAMSTAQMVGLGAAALLGVAAIASSISDDAPPPPPPAPEPVSLTLAEALALPALPAAYTLTSESLDAGAVSVAQANATYARVAAILDGATGNAPALTDVFQWQIRDGAANILGNREQASVRGAGRVELTDDTITSDQLGALNVLHGDAFVLGSTTIASGVYTLQALPAQVSLIEGVDLSGTDLSFGLDPNVLRIMQQAPVLTPTERNAGVQGAAGNPGVGDDLVLANSNSLIGAIIDLAGGHDTLYVDVTGDTAAALVQNVEVVELNNIANNNPATPSLVNLSTMLDINSLVITEAFNATDTLRVVGVRNNAEVTLRGSFNQDTSVNFLNSGILNLVLDDYFQNDGDLQIALDGSVLNLRSTGEGVLNAVDTGAFGPSAATTNLVNLNLTGDVSLELTGTNNAGMQFRDNTQAKIDATAFDGDSLMLVVAPHRDVSFTGSARNDNLTVTGARNNVGDTVLTLNAVMGAGDNVVTLQGADGAITYVNAGSVLSADDGTLQVVVTGLPGAGNIDMTRVSVENIDSVVFAAGNRLILNAGQVNTIGSENFSNNIGITNGGLLVRNLGEEKLDLSDLRVGTIVTVRTEPGTVVLNPETVLGNANAGVQILQIHAVGMDSSLTMTAQQFAQLDGPGIVVQTRDNNNNLYNNPVTGQPFQASLVIRDVAPEQVFDFTAVNLNGGITVQLTDGFVANGFIINNFFGPSDVTLVASGNVDLSNTFLTRVENIEISGAGILSRAIISGYGGIFISGDADLSNISLDGFSGITISGNADLIGAFLQNVGSIEISGNADLIGAFLQNVGSIEISGNADLSRAFLEFVNSIDISGDANLSGAFLQNVGSIEISGNADLIGATLQGVGSIEISGNADLIGATLQGVGSIDISGNADFRDSVLQNVGNIVMNDGSSATINAADFNANFLQSITGNGNFTLNVVGSPVNPVNLNLTEVVDLPGLTINFNNVGTPAPFIFNIDGQSDFTIKGITTGERVNQLEINNNLNGEFSLTGGSSAITLNEATTMLNIITAGDMVLGTGGNPGHPGLRAPGLTELSVFGTGDVNLGTIEDVADSFNLNVDVVGNPARTVTATLAESAPANAIRTFSNVTLRIAEGVEFGDGSQLVLNNVNLISEVDLATLPISSASIIVLDLTNPPAEITALLGNLAGRTASANVTGMDTDQLAAIANAITKIAPGGLTRDLHIDSSLTAVQIGAIYGSYTRDTSTSTVNAQGMTPAQLAAIVPGDVSDLGIRNLNVTAELNPVQIGALLELSQNASVNATGMDAARLNAVAGAIGSAPDAIDNVDNITNLTLVAGVNAQAITRLFLKIEPTDAGSVTVNAQGMVATALSAVVRDIAKVSTIENLTLAQGTTVAEMGALLSKADGATVNAVGMTSDQLSTVAANAARITSIRNLEIDNELSAADITALLAITQDTRPSVDLTDLSDAQFNAIVPQVSNVTIFGDTTATRLQALDTALTPTLNASGIDEISGTIAQLDALFAAQTAGSIASLNGRDLIITDSGSITATSVNGLADRGGEVTVRNATTITGTAQQLFDALTLPNVDLSESNPNILVTNPANNGATPPVQTEITFAQLAAIGNTTTGTVTVQNAVTIIGIFPNNMNAFIDGGNIVAASANLVVNGYGSIQNDTHRLTVAQLDDSTTGTVTLNGAASASVFNLTGYNAALFNGGNLIINGNAGTAVTFTANGGAHTLTGGFLSDVFTITGGNHTLTGGFGADTFTLSAGTQTITDLGTSDVLVTTGTAAVTAATTGFMATSATYNTSSGTVTLNTSGTVGVTIDMAEAGTGNGQGSNPPAGTAGYTINGGAGNDTLTGSRFADVITGNAGNDTISGGAGNDTITGGAGNDTITGGAGNDSINLSGGGQNTIVFEATAATNGVDTITGFQAGGATATLDVLNFSGFGVTGNIDATVTAPTALNVASRALADDGIFVVNLGATTAIAAKDFGGAQFGEIFGATNNYLNVELNGQAVVVVQGSDRSEVYYVDSATAANVVAADVTLVAVLNGVTNTLSFVDANFA